MTPLPARALDRCPTPPTPNKKLEVIARGIQQVGDLVDDVH